MSPLEDSRRAGIVRVWSMRKGIFVKVTAADRARLEAVVANRNSPQKHVWRASIVLLTADGLGTTAVMRGSGRRKSPGVALAGAAPGTGRDAARPAQERAPRAHV